MELQGLNGLGLALTRDYGIGRSLYAERPDRGRFVWPAMVDRVVTLTAAQMSYLLQAIDWRNPMAVARNGARQRLAENDLIRV